MKKGESLITNYGLLHEQVIDSRDHLLGGFNVLSINNESADWRPFAPVLEIQRGYVFDTMACVSFSALNCLEAIIDARYGIKVNFSDRFTAKVSGTTKRGNYFSAVAQSLRDYGAVLEEDYSFDKSFTWDEYYSTIPDSVYEKGRSFLNEWEVNYAWAWQVGRGDYLTKENLREALKYSPVQIAILYASDNGSVIPYPGIKDTNHAVALLYIDDKGQYHIYDTYQNGHKILAADYYISSAMVYNISKKKPMDITIPEQFKKGTHFVQDSTGSGEFALIIDGQMRTGPVNELIATYIARTSGTGIPADLWDYLKSKSKTLKE